MPFATPNVTDMENLFTIFKFVNNQASDGIFFPIMLLVIWVITFVGSIAEGRAANRAWLYSSFISAILGSLLTLMGFVDKNYIFFLILMIAFGIAWTKLQTSPHL